MSFKIVIFVAAVFAYEANAQLGGMMRPFTSGFVSGFNDVAKPVPFGEAVRPTVPRVPQVMPYPSQYIPSPPGAFDRFESFVPGMPGANYFQTMVPPGNFKPQAQFYQIQSQYMKPLRPYPVRPAMGETLDKYRPSSLLIQPPAEVPRPEVPRPEGPATLEAQFEVPKPEAPATLDSQFEVPKPEGPATLDAEFDVPTMQRPLPIEEDQQ